MLKRYIRRIPHLKSIVFNRNVNTLENKSIIDDDEKNDNNKKDIEKKEIISDYEVEYEPNLEYNVELYKDE